MKAVAGGRTLFFFGGSVATIREEIRGEKIPRKGSKALKNECLLRQQNTKKFCTKGLTSSASLICNFSSANAANYGNEVIIPFNCKAVSALVNGEAN